MAGRSIEERARHVVERLEGDADIWIATASRDGRPHLVPLSLYWDGTRIVVTNPKSSVTTVNVASTGIARFALNSSEDVVIIDAIVTVVDLADAADGLPERYAERAGWDPRD
ncbi:MAG TPA: pyridoxamine 5'-phosphate oxidase family protein, partial [Ilumatobacteraceae bacterium]|nr:pyridoxamine 5'-phosphate oxidase family protein [Ilumatobacteraceae bacterium]